MKANLVAHLFRNIYYFSKIGESPRCIIKWSPKGSILYLSNHYLGSGFAFSGHNQIIVEIFEVEVKSHLAAHLFRNVYYFSKMGECPRCIIKWSPKSSILYLSNHYLGSGFAFSGHNQLNTRNFWSEVKFSGSSIPKCILFFKNGRIA